MSKIHYELTAYKNGEPYAGFDINQNQMEMIAIALSEYQDSVYNEEIHLDGQDASDLSELQGNIGSL